MTTRSSMRWTAALPFGLAIGLAGCISNPEASDDPIQDAAPGDDATGAFGSLDAGALDEGLTVDSAPDAALDPDAGIDPDATMDPDAGSDPDAAVILQPSDGESCGGEGDCQGNFCIEEWPGGYCTTVGCETFEDCATVADEENRCFIQGRGADNFCVRMCQGSGACREGYICQPVGRNQGACFPDPRSAVLDEAAVEALPFEVKCQGPAEGTRFEFDFEIDESTTAYMVTAFSMDGGQLSPQRIEGPAGRIDFQRANAFQTVTTQLFGSIAPMIVPAHSGLTSQLAAGEHTFSLRSESEQICMYLLQEAAPGTRIDVNVYLVGLDTTPEQARESENLQEVFATVSAIYAQSGVELGEIRYFTLDEAADQRFGVLRSQDDATALLKLTTSPGPTADEALSLNVVFTRAFALREGQGVLGMSMGLPGPAGLHGTVASGVLFTAEFIGQEFRDGGGTVVEGNAYTGAVMAHEIGHYLGLFHTSETDGRSQDPYDDTARCRDFSAPERCPDIDNLMFPLARGAAGILSPRQRSVVQNSPLSKE